MSSVINYKIWKNCSAIWMGRFMTQNFLRIPRKSSKYIRSDDGPEFTAKNVRRWLTKLGVKTLFIEPGSSPWVNGYIESP